MVSGLGILGLYSPIIRTLYTRYFAMFGTPGYRADQIFTLIALFNPVAMYSVAYYTVVYSNVHTVTTIFKDSILLKL